MSSGAVVKIGASNPAGHKASDGNRRQIVKRILLVQDNPEAPAVRRILKRLEDYHVEVARTAKSALKLLSRGRFHVAMVGAWLPDMSGLALIQTVRHDFQIPVISLNNRPEADNGPHADYAESDLVDPEALVLMMSTVGVYA